MTQQMIRNVLPGWTNEYKRLDSWINDTKKVLKNPKHLSWFGIQLYSRMIEHAEVERARCKRTIRQYLEELGEVKPNCYRNKSAAQIKSEIDLVVYASRYTQLKKRGHNFTGLCPIHQEKTPSFIVSGQRWHCFGCSEGGDVFDLERKINKCDFATALQKVGAV